MKKTNKIALTSIIIVASTTLIALATAGTFSDSSNVLIGNTKIEPWGYILKSGQTEAFKMKAIKSDPTGTFHLWVGTLNTATSVNVGLYSESEGHAGSLITSGVISSPKKGEWNEVSMKPASKIEAGTIYWLAFLGQGGELRYRDAHQPCSSETNSQTNLTSLPQTWGSGITYPECVVSAYITAGEEVVATTSTTPTTPVTTPTETTPITNPTPPVITGLTSPSCTSTVKTISEVENSSSGVICLPSGTYGSISIKHPIEVEPVPGQEATIGAVTISGSNITIHNFSINGGVNIKPGSNHVDIDHNNITGGGEGINGGGVNCTSPGAPKYSGCTTEAAIENIIIHGNKIHGYGEGGTEDGIHINNWHHFVVTENEEYNLEETGNHTDGLQSVWGGSDMVYKKNYVHDFQAQCFFLKDGLIEAPVVVEDNLFLKGNNKNLDEYCIQLFGTNGAVIKNNTDWSSEGDILRENVPNAVVENNVFQIFQKIESSSLAAEGNNIFTESPWSFTANKNDKIEKNPPFINPSENNYELASGQGVNWKPSEFVYGPTGQ